MRRRGFLGFIGGAAVAGPSMVKNAATMADLRIPAGVAASVSSSVGEAVASDGPWNDPSHAIERLAKWNVLRLNPEWLERKRRDRWVDALDPDLASYRSISLSSKIRMQRNRNFDHWLEGQGNWLERAITGERDEF